MDNHPRKTKLESSADMTKKKKKNPFHQYANTVKSPMIST